MGTKAGASAGGGDGAPYSPSVTKSYSRTEASTRARLGNLADAGVRVLAEARPHRTIPEGARETLAVAAENAARLGNCEPSSPPAYRRKGEMPLTEISVQAKAWGLDITLCTVKACRHVYTARVLCIPASRLFKSEKHWIDYLW